MARKLPRLQRVLDAPALFSIAYGEIASSIYFALGIIAFHALGFTPAVLLLVGAVFVLVSLSYAEGTAATRETGGAATLVRIAFNDLWGFITGWALFLDYLIVIALSALFMPHYLAGAFFTKIHRPWDVIAGCGVIACRENKSAKPSPTRSTCVARSTIATMIAQRCRRVRCTRRNPAMPAITPQPAMTSQGR